MCACNVTLQHSSQCHLCPPTNPPGVPGKEGEYVMCTTLVRLMGPHSQLWEPHFQKDRFKVEKKVKT